MQSEIKVIINNAKAENATTINFNVGELIIQEFPSEILQLENLQSINLGNTEISKIPNEIKNLRKLTELIIHKSNFTSFPTVLMEVESLKDLSLGASKLKELPKKISQWSNLTYLNLSNSHSINAIEAFPSNLTYLYLNCHSLTEIPQALYDLKYLKKIVISGFLAESIPLRIFHLKSLAALFMINGNLKSVPNEIKELDGLRSLVLRNNELSEFPKSVCSIPKLDTLHLDDNHISNIPAEIINLKELQSLDLGSNNFTEIPTVLFQLKSLNDLRFGNFTGRKSRNSITSIHNEILNLTALTELEIYGNTIENIPTLIIEKGWPAIRNFLESKIEAISEEFLYEAKMVIVGRGNVGKSVLTRKLTDPEFILDTSDTTNGINVLKAPFSLTINKLDDKPNFRFNIWDFGGQEKYDATHQLFITDRSIYLFLTEARDESNYLDFYYWLNTIKLFSNSSPTIVILSKCDERLKHLPETEYKEKFKNIVQFVNISCAPTYEYTIENLKTAIANAVMLLPQTKQTLPNKWIEIRNELEKRSSKVDYISYEEYLSICATHGLNQTKADFLSQYLNDLGVIIHHSYDLLLKKTVFLNTDWSVDGLYKVLDDETVFNNGGKFTNKDLLRIWGSDRFEGKQAELIKLMKEYNLCFELRDGSAFIAPDLLPIDKPAEGLHAIDFDQYFEYRYDFMPAGILSRFIVKSHSFIKSNLYWKAGVILEYDETVALVEEDYINRKIKIALTGFNKKGLLSAIRMNINEVHSDFDKSNKIVFEEMVQCNCKDCHGTASPYFFKLSVLRNFERKAKTTISCEVSAEDVGIQSLINDVQIKSPGDFLQTNQDLKDFLMDVVSNVLEKEIKLKGGFHNFWRDVKCSEPKNETEFQPYISSVLDHYCKVKGIQLSREVKEANGSVDIMFSFTNNEGQILKVCMEIKKAHHNDVANAVATQLPMYMTSGDTDCGIYLVFWFKHPSYVHPAKFENSQALLDVINSSNPDRDNISVKIIECIKINNPSLTKNLSTTPPAAAAP